MAELIVLACLFAVVLAVMAISHRNTVSALLAQNRDLLKTVAALSEKPTAVSLAHQMERSDAQAALPPESELTPRQRIGRMPFAGATP